MLALVYCLWLLLRSLISFLSTSQQNDWESVSKMTLSETLNLNSESINKVSKIAEEHAGSTS